MYREGYLLRCVTSLYEAPQLYYCVFGEGKLKYYAEEGGKYMGELQLAGKVSKVRIEKSTVDKLPNRFSVTTSEVLTIEGSRMKVGDTKMIEFSAPSHELMKEWANAIHLWRRMNWKENVTFFSDDPKVSMSFDVEKSTLQIYLRNLYGTKYDTSNKSSTTTISLGGTLLNPIKSILYVQASPTVQKIRQKIMSYHRSNNPKPAKPVVVGCNPTPTTVVA